MTPASADRAADDGRSDRRGSAVLAIALLEWSSSPPIGWKGMDGEPVRTILETGVTEFGVGP